MSEILKQQRKIDWILPIIIIANIAVISYGIWITPAKQELSSCPASEQLSLVSSSYDLQAQEIHCYYQLNAVTSKQLYHFKRSM